MEENLDSIFCPEKVKTKKPTWKVKVTMNGNTIYTSGNTSTYTGNWSGGAPVNGWPLAA